MFAACRRNAAPVAGLLYTLASPSHRTAHAETSDSPLPTWLAKAVSAGRLTDEPNMKSKIQAYDVAQASLAATTANRQLPSPPPRGCPQRLRIVSYNVHFLRDSQFRDNKSRVLDVLASLDADVICLQEVCLPPAGQEVHPGPVLSEQQVSVEAIPSDIFQKAMDASFKPRNEADIFLGGLHELGYTSWVSSPSFWGDREGLYEGPLEGPEAPREPDVPMGNMVLSRRPLCSGDAASKFPNEGVVLDFKRLKTTRSASIATLSLGGSGGVPPFPLTVVSMHLDVWAETYGHFGMAEGDLIRLLEVEALDHQLAEAPVAIVAGDFNSPSRLASLSSPAHRQVADILDVSCIARNAHMFRHTLPRDAQQRLRDEWALTATSFLEQRCGFVHCWQVARASGGLPPLYSHWSGQLIDHCYLRPGGPDESIPKELRVANVAVYHTDASDHLPIVVDLELSSDPESSTSPL